MAYPGLNYKLERVATGSGVGWFKCLPAEEWEFSRALDYLEQHPYDLFMHNYALEKLGAYEPEQLASFIRKNRNGSPVVRALIYEAWVRNWKFESSGIILREDPSWLKEYTPLIDIRWVINQGQKHNPYWLKCFASNFYRHTELPEISGAQFPLPFEKKQLQAMFEKTFHVKELAAVKQKAQARAKIESPKSFIKELNRKLERLNILSGWETRTEATISPFAVERPWRLDINIKDGRNEYGLKGMQTSYGKGLNIHQARISCLMETVERYSAFPSVRDASLEGYLYCNSLIKGSHAELTQDGYHALDPNKMSLEVPYDGYPILWVEGEEVSQKGKKSILVPAQLVFMFTNFDEMNLTSGISSTGLGAGITSEEAKLSALHEIIERDAEKVVPFSRDKCFRLDSDDDRVYELLRFLERKGIHVQFMDLTSEFGVPCYKAFVCGPGGVILKGSGAHLDGKKAIISALTEIPYPYPYWFGSMEPLEEIPTLFYEELPNYSAGDAGIDLELLETLLLKNGYQIIYVNLTREEIGIPVVRALVPGLEFMTFFDRYTPLSCRQFAHYLHCQTRS